MVGADGGVGPGVPLEVGVVEADEDDGAVGGGVVDGLPEELRHRDVRLLALGQVDLAWGDSHVISDNFGWVKGCTRKRGDVHDEADNSTDRLRECDCLRQ